MPPHATRPWRAPAALLALLAALALVVPLTASRVHAAEHDRSHGSGRAVRQSTMVSRYLFTAFTNSGCPATTPTPM